MDKGLKGLGSVRNGRGDAGGTGGTMGNKRDGSPSDKNRVKSVEKREKACESVRNH